MGAMSIGIPNEIFRSLTLSEYAEYYSLLNVYPQQKVHHLDEENINGENIQRYLNAP